MGGKCCISSDSTPVRDYKLLDLPDSSCQSLPIFIIEVSKYFTLVPMSEGANGRKESYAIPSHFTLPPVMWMWYVLNKVIYINIPHDGFYYISFLFSSFSEVEVDIMFSDFKGYHVLVPRQISV